MQSQTALAGVLSITLKLASANEEAVADLHTSIVHRDLAAQCGLDHGLHERYAVWRATIPDSQY